MDIKMVDLCVNLTGPLGCTDISLNIIFQCVFKGVLDETNIRISWLSEGGCSSPVWVCLTQSVEDLDNTKG